MKIGWVDGAIVQLASMRQILRFGESGEGQVNVVDLPGLDSYASA